MDLNFDYPHRNRVRIKLKDDSVYEGKYLPNDRTNRIDIYDVILLPSKKKINGILYFYSSEVEEVCDLEPERTLLHQAIANAKPKQILTPVECERLAAMPSNFVYISKMDINYEKAVQHLEQCESIGVTAIGLDGKEYNGSKDMNLLVLASWDQVYIFDVYSFGIVPLELKRILESKLIKKVLHNSKIVVQALKRIYEIDMKYIFDTYIAHRMIEENRHKCGLPRDCEQLQLLLIKLLELSPEEKQEGKANEIISSIRETESKNDQALYANAETVHPLKSLFDCIQLYLSLPYVIDYGIWDIETESWMKRPLALVCKLKVAESVSYLVSLKNILAEILLEPIYIAVEENLKLTPVDTIQLKPSKLTYEEFKKRSYS